MPISLVLHGCASTPVIENAKPDVRVVGSGTDDARAAINSTNQKIFDSEHAMSPENPVASGNQDVP